MAPSFLWLAARAGALAATLTAIARAEAEPPQAEPSQAEPPQAPTQPTLEEQVRQLEQRVAEQDARIAELERANVPTTKGEDRRAHTPAAAPVDRAQREDPLSLLTSKDFPRSVPLFGSDFRFAVGGYVKVDAIYDFAGLPDRYRFALAGIPKRDDPVDSAPYFSVHARETRLKFDVRYMGKGAPSNQAVVEFDFFTPSTPGYISPRLRHAYLRWGDFLAGQTWALLTDMRPLPFIIDFAFADSINAARVPQLRYQAWVTNFLVVRAGIEMPELGGVDNPEDLAGAVSPRLPRAAVGASLETKRGFVSGGASVNEIRWDGTGVSTSRSALGWAAVLNGRFLLDEKGRGVIGAHGSIGEGNAESVGALAGQNGNATLTATSLEPMLSGHGMVGISNRWIELMSTNVAVAWDILVPSPERSPDALAWAWSVHANVIVHVSEPLRLGAEAMLGESANVDGRSGRATRLQAMAMYSF